MKSFSEWLNYRDENLFNEFRRIGRPIVPAQGGQRRGLFGGRPLLGRRNRGRYINQGYTGNAGGGVTQEDEPEDDIMGQELEAAREAERTAKFGASGTSGVTNANAGYKMGTPVGPEGFKDVDPTTGEINPQQNFKGGFGGTGVDVATPVNVDQILNNPSYDRNRKNSLLDAYIKNKGGIEKLSMPDLNLIIKGVFTRREFDSKFMDANVARKLLGANKSMLSGSNISPQMRNELEEIANIPTNTKNTGELRQYNRGEMYNRGFSGDRG
jgi:hypothetical protein